MKLYELTNEYKSIMDELYDEDTGEMNPQALARIDAIKEPLERKATNLVKFCKGIEAECKAIKEERDRLMRREKAFKNSIDSLKEYLLVNMQKASIKKIECPQFTISLRENRPSVDDFDFDAIPQEYKKIEVSVRKADILSDLKMGVVVPGARMKYDPYIEIR